MTPTSPGTDSAPGLAGQAYHDLIREQLHDAAASKESLERRGFAVVTTSGAVFTVVVGAASFARQGIPASAGALLFAAIALVFLIAAMVSGLVVNFPLGYAGVAPSELRRVADSDAFWTGPLAKALQRVAQVEADAVASALGANGRKATWLRFGLAFEVAAFIALGVAGLLVLVALR